MQLSVSFAMIQDVAHESGISAVVVPGVPVVVGATVPVVVAVLDSRSEKKCATNVMRRGETTTRDGLKTAGALCAGVLIGKSAGASADLDGQEY